MKKYLAVAGTLLLLAVYAPFSQAQTTSPDNLRSLDIAAAILAQQLQNPSTASEGQLANFTTSSNYYFGSSVGHGSSGDEVTHLQEALVGSGYLPSSDATGYYGDLTQQAVEKYQSANGISSTGYVGPLTLGSLNNWWSRHHSPTAPVATTTPPVAVPPIATTTPPVVATTSAPTVTLMANPGNVTIGNSSLLTWYSTNATRCTAKGFTNTSGVAGSATVWPDLVTTYSMTCAGKSAAAVATATATVTVTAAVSNPVPPVAIVNVPGAPSSVSVTAGNAQATVSFTAPSSNGGASITSYTVTSSGGQTASGSASPITVTGLANGTSYTFTVKATNSAGTGSVSVASSAVTPVAPVVITIPGAPTAVNAIAGNAQATVSFAAPSSNGGSVVTSYTVTSNSGKSASGNTSPITVTGLSNGTVYTFTVKATNSVGTGSASSVSNSVTPVAPVTVTVPGAPTGVTATAGSAQATVSFVAPSSTGGAAITSYTVTSSGGQTVSGSASPLIVTGLTNGTKYTFTVVAKNTVGASVASTKSSSVTPTAPVTIVVPGAPTSVTATAGNAQATVSFTAPASNGGAAISSYVVTSNSGQSASGSASPITVTGLTNGTSYTFTVKAINSAGTGSASAASNSVTPAAPVSTTPPPVSSGEPAQAISAGYNLNTFSTDSNFNPTTVDIANTQKSGYKWYQFDCYGYPASFANDATNTDGSMTVGGNSTNFGSNMVSATCKSGSPGYVGTAFGGGAYIQMTAKYNPVTESSTYIGDNGWPALWTYALEQMVPLPGEQWPGQATGYLHYFEGDLMENFLSNYGVPLNQFTATNHDWYSTNPPNTNIQNQAFITVPNFNTYHTYGMLWIPATATASGTISYYLDGTNIGTTHYSKLSATQTPPPSDKKPWEYAIIDNDHLTLQIGSDNAVPLTVQSVDVWQASAANNLVN